MLRNAFHKAYTSTSKNPQSLLGHQVKCNSISSAAMTSSRASVLGDNHNLTLTRTSEIGGVDGNRDLVLGLRSSRPPDSVSRPKVGLGKSPKRDPDEELSDDEWDIRTGRALFVLQDTLPEFFKTGLVTNVDKSTGMPVKSSSGLPLSLGPSANPLDLLHQSSNEGGNQEDGDVEPIYSPRVKLEYTPPVALPTPFPRTLHIEGLPLYLASASFMRHTMNALYSDLVVTLTKVSLDVPPPPKAEEPSEGGPGGDLKKSDRKKRALREKSLVVRFMVTGNARVSGGSGEWEVESTYIFSPVSGLIHKQVINSIHPAPHQAVYESLGKLVGFGWSSGRGNVGNGPAPGTMCDGHLK